MPVRIRCHSRPSFSPFGENISGERLEERLPGSRAPVSPSQHINGAQQPTTPYSPRRCDRLQPGPKRLFRMSNYQGKRGSILIGNGLSRLQSYKPRPFKRSSDLTGRSTQWSCNNQQHHQTDSRFGASVVSPT